MKEQVIYQSGGAEVIWREILYPGDPEIGDYTLTELELKIGGWRFDQRFDDDRGIRAMIMSIDYLAGELTRIREILVARREDQQSHVA